MIEIRSLNYIKGKKQILQNVNLYFEKDCITGILGANGSGKTTLLKHLVKEIRSRGNVFIDGIEIDEIPRREFSKKVSFVSQNTVYPDEIILKDIVKMGRYPYKKMFLSYTANDENIIKKSLQYFDLESLQDKPLGTVSGGEAKRTLIAKAFAQQTEIMILDEPINHLDIKYQLELMKRLKNMREKTIIMSIHNIEFALKFCKNVVLMKEGKIIAFGKAKDVLTEDNIRETFGVETEWIAMKGKKVLFYK